MSVFHLSVRTSKTFDFFSANFQDRSQMFGREFSDQWAALLLSYCLSVRKSFAIYAHTRPCYKIRRRLILTDVYTRFIAFKIYKEVIFNKLLDGWTYSRVAMLINFVNMSATDNSFSDTPPIFHNYYSKI